MTNEEREIHELRKRLESLQRSKRERSKKPAKVSTAPKGRPSIPQADIKRARDLAKDFPIPDVALVTGISMTSLYRNGVKRKELDKEKALAVGRG